MVEKEETVHLSHYFNELFDLLNRHLDMDKEQFYTWVKSNFKNTDGLFGDSKCYSDILEFKSCYEITTRVVTVKIKYHRDN